MGKKGDDIQIVEDGPDKEKKAKLCPQIIASIIATLSFLAAGLIYSWPTPVLPQIETKTAKLHVTSDEGGWIVSALPIGAIFGPIVSALLIDNIGRKWFLYITSVPFIACWILTYLATDWLLLFVGRLVGGISIGSIFAAVPVYLGEIVEPRIRGAVGTLLGLSLSVGNLLMCGIGPLVDMKLLALFCLVPTVVFVLTAAWLPESPYYSLKKGKRETAELSLVWLRGKIDNEKEINEIVEYINAEEKGGFKELFTDRINRKSLLIVLLLSAGQQLSGLGAIQSYAGFLFKDMSLKLSPNDLVLILCGLGIVAGALSMVVIDRFGRRYLFLISSYIVGLCLCLIGVYFVLQKQMKLDKFSWVPLAVSVVYYIFTSLALTSIVSVVSSEIFSIRVKRWATMFIHIFGSLLNLIVAKCYQLVVDAFGYPVIFFAFGIIELIVATTAVFVLPETSKKSLADIQKTLHKDEHKKIDKTEKKKELEIETLEAQ
ncbi:facilitated trehalose transporter Tret1-like isoform X2 [Hylaeus volcanicus]|nr:facilitated trehalose transporter Tret1-like isoform X2 [Hylaeus volcanicus]XP_053975236.1 facilitated trehalose transporter Tret1-like isoform X2 [Hylaeus volcanicus]